MRLTVFITVIAAITQSSLADALYRRGTEGMLAGGNTSMNDAGVSIRSETGAVHFVPWDRVRDVQMSASDPRLKKYLQTASDLWRARSRVERHDTTLAEPLLERLWGQYRGQSNETALVVAEGLLRCRLSRGDHAAALLPALEVTRLRRLGIDTVSYSMLRPILDPQFELCPLLAPVWLQSRSLSRLEHDLAEYDAGDDAVVAAMARLYRLAAIQESPTPEGAGDLGDIPKDHPGLDLLEASVRSRGDDRDARGAAREWLGESVDRIPSWAEAWARYSIGVSLMQESGIGRKQEGLLSLTHLPARFGRTQPFLVGIALARMVRGLTELGDLDAAAAIEAELTRFYPGHPVVRLMATDGLDLSSPPSSGTSPASNTNPPQDTAQNPAKPPAANKDRQ